MSKKSILGQSNGHGKICQNALIGTLFKQLPRAQIGLKFKNVWAHQIANNQTIILCPENVLKLNFTSSRVSPKNCGGLQVPNMEVPKPLPSQPIFLKVNLHGKFLHRVSREGLGIRNLSN